MDFGNSASAYFLLIAMLYFIVITGINKKRKLLLRNKNKKRLQKQRTEHFIRIKIYPISTYPN